MHRIAYKKDDLTRLHGIIESLYLHRDRTYHWTVREQLERILSACQRAGYGHEVYKGYNYRPKAISPNPDILYKELKRISEISSQYGYSNTRYWKCIHQTMYHLPYRELPLMINHKSPVVRAIVSWRLDVGK